LGLPIFGGFMARERRSLWGSISQSKKVNKLSLKGALLYTWAIPHFDDEGFQAGEPRDIKINIVPFREDIQIEEIKDLIIELSIAGLWKVFHLNSTVFIHDPVWNERQSFKGIHKIPSKIKEIIGETPETVFYNTEQGVQCHLGRCIREVKLSKEKRSEVKGSTPKDSSHPTLEELKERRKTLKEQLKEIQDGKHD
jgi:hypothetical protein